VPAALKLDTVRKLRVLREHWDIGPIRIETYELLGSRNGGAMLEFKDPQTGERRGYRPDVIVLDECYMVKNPQSGRTRKLRRYIKEARAEGRKIVVVAMTGTGVKRSIRDAAHTLAW